MTNQDYMEWLLKSQVLSDAEITVLRRLKASVEKLLCKLDGAPRFYFGGSYGKETIIRERYDLDIIAYWPKDTKYTIKEIYDGVGSQLQEKWKSAHSKTVAWEINFEGGFHIDVVPGRALDDKFKEANLYRTDTRSTLKTSLKTHIDTIKNSGRRQAIRLMKLWSMRRKVPFKKSFLLEIMTINGCKGSSLTDLPAQTEAGLQYVCDNIETINIKDPANSKNSLSDDITKENKTRIKMAAQSALNAGCWKDVFEQ